MAKKAAKVVDPNRVPVKRERSEAYQVVAALDRARVVRGQVVKRLVKLDDARILLGEIDKDIARLGKRLAELATGTPAEPVEAR